MIVSDSFEKLERCTQEPRAEPAPVQRMLRDRSNLKPPDRYLNPIDITNNYLCVAEGDEPFSYREAIQGPEAKRWKQAMKEEMEAHKKNKTWDLAARPPGARILANRWVYKIKIKADGTTDRYKARIVTKGYQQREGVDY